jgi:hypothetical protein
MRERRYSAARTGGLCWMTAQPLALHERLQRAGRMAVVGIGSSPGKTIRVATTCFPSLSGAAAASR